MLTSKTVVTDVTDITDDVDSAIDIYIIKMSINNLQKQTFKI